MEPLHTAALRTAARSGIARRKSPLSLAVRLPSPIEWIPYLLLGVALVTAAPFVITFLINGLAPVVVVMAVFFYWRKRVEA